MAVWAAFPVAGYIGWTVGGRVDAVDAALVGGAHGDRHAHDFEVPLELPLTATTHE